MTEKEFTPSQWCQRMDPGSVVAEYVKKTLAQTEKCKREIPCDIGIRYGSKPRETLDLYGTDLARDSPIFFFVPGGYWTEGSSENGGSAVTPLYEEGIKTVVVDYDRAPGVSLTQIVDEVINSARWLMKYSKENGCKCIVVSGHSVGAQLAAMIFCSKWFTGLSREDKALFQAIVYTGGLFHVTPLLQTTIVDDLNVHEEEAESMSPLKPTNLEISLENCQHMRQKLIAYGIHEAPALKKQCDDYAQALEQGGYRKVKVLHLQSEDHFDLIEKLSSQDYALTQEIVRLCKEN